MNKDWDLTGKKVLVTGASKGIGAATAKMLAELGAEVFSVSRNYPGKSGMKCDVTISDDRKKLFDTLKDKWGTLDILVNNAGTNNRKQMLESTDADYGELITLNMGSVYELCRLFHPLLKKSKQAAIVNVSSVAADTFVGSGLTYAMTKAAVNQLTKYLAVDWAKDGIRINAVAPWYIDTPLTEKYVKNEEFLSRVNLRTPLGRIGRPEEVAAVISFLAMPASSYVTGEVISVDGGFMKYGF
jgi:tropinone reductase I